MLSLVAVLTRQKVAQHVVTEIQKQRGFGIEGAVVKN